MKADTLRLERVKRGWSQNELARRLNVSQPYVVMLEKGKRPVTAGLRRKLMKVYKLSPAALPSSPDFVPKETEPQRLAQDLALLGYPGFAYLRAHVAKKNPGEVLLTALGQKALEPRLAEALPWLLLKYSDMDFTWVVTHAKSFNLQNRLGYLASLARKMAEREEQRDRTVALTNLESELNLSRLAREDDFPKPVRGQAERRWLQQNRPDEAKHWNLLTSLQPEHLSYDARTA